MARISGRLAWLKPGGYVGGEDADIGPTGSLMPLSSFKAHHATSVEERAARYEMALLSIITTEPEESDARRVAHAALNQE